jgi:hypothetical protein
VGKTSNYRFKGSSSTFEDTHTAAWSRRQSKLDIETMVGNHRACDADWISYLMEINPKL